MSNKIKKCDCCGKNFTGKVHPVYDENYVKQRGIIQCDECYASDLQSKVECYDNSLNQED
jgi:tRNA 2-selenouridine synthase SelU